MVMLVKAYVTAVEDAAKSKPEVAVPASEVPAEVVQTLLSAKVISIVICGNTLTDLSKLEINPLCFPAFNF